MAGEKTIDIDDLTIVPEKAEKLRSLIKLDALNAILARLGKEILTKGGPVYLLEATVFDYLNEMLPDDNKLEVQWSEQIELTKLPTAEWASPKLQFVFEILFKALIQYHNYPVIYEQNIAKEEDQTKRHTERRQRVQLFHGLLKEAFFDLISLSKIRYSNVMTVSVLFESVSKRLQIEFEKNESEGKDNSKILQLQKFAQELNEIFISKTGKPVMYYQSVDTDKYASRSQNKDLKSGEKAWTEEEKVDFALSVNPKIKRKIEELKEIFES